MDLFHVREQPAFGLLQEGKQVGHVLGCKPLFQSFRQEPDSTGGLRIGIVEHLRDKQPSIRVEANPTGLTTSGSAATRSTVRRSSARRKEACSCAGVSGFDGSAAAVASAVNQMIAAHGTRPGTSIGF